MTSIYIIAGCSGGVGVIIVGIIVYCCLCRKSEKEIKEEEDMYKKKLDAVLDKITIECKQNSPKQQQIDEKNLNISNLNEVSNLGKKLIYFKVMSLQLFFL